MTGTANGNPPALTERQRQVVELIALGCSNDEVGLRTRHLGPHREGPLRRAAAEARRRKTTADPRRIQDAHGRGPPIPRARAGLGRRRGLTATRARRQRPGRGAPLFSGCGAVQNGVSGKRDNRSGSGVGPAGGTMREGTQTDDVASAESHHQAPATDKAPGRLRGQADPARSPGGLRQDDACPRMDGRLPAAARVVSSLDSIRGRRCAGNRARC